VESDDTTTLGTLMVNEILPESLRSSKHVLNKNGVHKLLMRVAELYPDKYKDVVDRLSDVGRTAVWTEGMSVNLSSLLPAKAKLARTAALKLKVHAILADDSLTDEDRRTKISEALLPEADTLAEAVYAETKEDPENPYVIMMESGARGKKSDISAMRGAELLTSDAAGKIIPVPLWNSYGEGFTPAEYFAASYAQRANSVVTKLATADAGFMSKRLGAASHRLTVTKDRPTNTRLQTGLPVDAKDRDNIGAVLARDVGAHKAGTLITSDMVDDFADDKIDEILIHSPMTELSEDGGISQWSAGRRTQSGLSLIGDNIGVAAAQAIGEKISQGSLGGKHRGTVTKKAMRGGIEYLNRLLDAPENFPEAGPLADEDGRVKKIWKAPQGGTYVQINDKQYYLHEGVDPVVKEGDAVEYGDEISDGVPHPTDLIKKLGMGEARRVYLGHFNEALQNSGAKVSRRNVEPVVAGLLNWAEVKDPDGIGDSVYGDTVPFNRMAFQYKPRAASTEELLDTSIGKYLEEPALHYTPGTRITRKVAKRLKGYGINKAFVHAEAPNFEPIMQRSALAVYNDPDWRTQLGGFYTASAFQHSLERGAISDPNSTSFIPAMGKPSVLGKHLTLTGKYGKAQ